MLVGTIEDGAKEQPIVLANTSREIEGSFRRHPTAEQVEGQCTQREDVEVLAAALLLTTKRFWCHEHTGGVFDQLLDV
jgi:hypothetical protein